MEIAQTGNTDLLVISGKPSEQQIQEQWEKIVKRNSETAGSSASHYFENIKTYAKLLSDYELVKLSLMQLMIVVDDEAIAFLGSKGYRIDTSTASGYSESIKNAMQKCKNIITKLKTQHNQIMNANLNQNEVPKTSIEEVLANISISIGFCVEINVTLARFNEYKKIIKKKIEASKMKVV